MLSGKTALITGGVKNLGAEIAIQLAGQGANLALHYNSDKSKEDAIQLQTRLQKSFPNIEVVFYQANLITAAGVDKLFASVIHDFGEIAIVVNTVGKVLKKPIAEISEVEYDEMFAINSKAAFLILQAGAKNVKDGGKLITIVTSLLAAFTGLYTSYAGSKAPVEHFTRGVAKELQDRGVSVNAIAPGPMDTRESIDHAARLVLFTNEIVLIKAFFYPQETDDAVAFHKSMAIGNRLTDIKDIAPIVKFLCTEGGWITGQTIFANGGYTTR